VASGARVQEGQVLFEFETSKATMEFESPGDGYFHTWLEKGQELAVGEAVGVISDQEVVPEEALASLKRPPEAKPEPVVEIAAGSATRFSKPAQALIDEHGLSPDLFAGLQLVRREDVERVLQTGTQRAAGAAQQKERAAGAAHPVQPAGARPLGLIIFGGGGHAKMCIDVLRRMGTFEIVGILDSKLEIGSTVLGVPVIGRDTELPRLFDEGVRLAVNGVGAASSHKTRSAIFDRLKEAGFVVPNLVHPSAVVEASARLGEGNQVMAGAVLGSDATVANNCILNSNCVVSHDCELQDNVHVAPGAILGGHVKVGRDTLIGMGATVYLNVRIHDGVTISNSVPVFADVPSDTLLRH
jgi:sugar O-acyltransferase (sialic acid O-acetyltransferase NeuD family)